MKTELIKLAKVVGYVYPFKYEFLFNISTLIYTSVGYPDLSKEEADEIYYLWMCELQKWLGENHNIVCLPIYNETYNYWEYYVNQILSESPSIQKSAFSSYEEALEEGLLYSLKLLITQQL